MSATKNKRKYKVGIIGYGVVGKKRHSIIHNYNNFSVVAISDIQSKSLEDLSTKIEKYADYKKLIEDSECDLVFISLPNRFAADATKLALKKGLHVFCEKPPARDLKELRPIKALIKNSTLKLKYGFNHRYHASVMKAKKILQSKELGRIVAMRGIYGKSKIISFDQSDWRSKRSEAGGGILLDQGIHMLDLMLFFANEKFTEIHSIVRNDFWGHDVEDNAFALMQTSSGIVAQIHSSATQWRHTFNLEIILEKGSLVFGGLLTGSKSYGDETLTIIQSKPDRDKGLPQEITHKFNEDISWAEEVHEFFEAIEKNKSISQGTIDEAMNTMSLIEKIYKADKRWAKKYYNN
ncbi:MAG: Gfo/Idh/MocA family oxidoreductase [Proteobacteria bacterium]|nr:Gfo/Idh/MocA family oxidoreductase [Pseudomonadota bacterium]